MDATSKATALDAAKRAAVKVLLAKQLKPNDVEEKSFSTQTSAPRSDGSDEKRQKTNARSNLKPLAELSSGAMSRETFIEKARLIHKVSGHCPKNFSLRPKGGKIYSFAPLLATNSFFMTLK